MTSLSKYDYINSIKTIRNEKYNNDPEKQKEALTKLNLSQLSGRQQKGFLRKTLVTQNIGIVRQTFLLQRWVFAPNS